MQVAWLGEASCNDIQQTGGKAASLSRLAHQYPVPPGFCIPKHLSSRWRRSAIEPSHARPTEFIECIDAAYRELGERCGCANPPVAVRSSAIDEDGITASFAGQYETVLNVSGAHAIVEAVVACWASATSSRVAAYRRQKQILDHQPSVPVLVQHMISADIAAVAFSVNPVTHDRGEIVINASWGLGESLVDGSVTPDMYVVRRSDLRVLEQSIGAKRRMSIPISGGTSHIDVPPHLRDVATLGDDQITEVARLALDLELAAGTPVDIECAYEDGRLYLLQCRPVTTLR